VNETKPKDFPRPLQRAVKLAGQNTKYPKWRLAAVITLGGSTLSSGVSRLLSDPTTADFSAFKARPRVSAHSEIEALRRAPRASRGVLYVARIGRNGKIGMAKPCKQCQKEISAAGIKRVVYTISDSEYGVWLP